MADWIRIIRKRGALIFLKLIDGMTAQKIICTEKELNTSNTPCFVSDYSCTICLSLTTGTYLWNR